MARKRVFCRLARRARSVIAQWVRVYVPVRQRGWSGRQGYDGRHLEARRIRLSGCRPIQGHSSTYERPEASPSTSSPSWRWMARHSAIENVGADTLIPIATAALDACLTLDDEMAISEPVIRMPGEQVPSRPILTGSREQHAEQPSGRAPHQTYWSSQRIAGTRTGPAPPRANLHCISGRCLRSEGVLPVLPFIWWGNPCIMTIIPSENGPLPFKLR